jgi:predicted DsbA family dithiol-disulfide isomerase
MNRLLIIQLFVIAPMMLQGQSVPVIHEIKTTKTMTIEIWSDVMCPFCYIGKRKLEAALHQFSDKEQVEIVWRSFQLEPNLQTEPSKSVKKSLGEKKGWSERETEQMFLHVSEMAKTVGLEYHFDRAVVANSFDAHRFTHFAKSKGKQDAAEEVLFDAYFSKGVNTADHQALAQLGAQIGLDPSEVLSVLASDQYAAEVQEDLRLARQFGVTGVPFFVFNREYAISGAQDVQVFLNTLERVASSSSE